MEAKVELSASVSDQCVLLGGQPRSGTSLLTSILRSSGDLLQAFEIHIRKPSFVVGNDGSYTRNILKQIGLPPEEFDRILKEHSELVPSMNLAAWSGPKEEVSAEPLTGKETIAFEDELRARGALLAACMRRAAELEGCRRWGVKILGDVVHAAEYAAAFPNAQVVLLIRDPRDHALSVMKLNEQRKARGQQLFYESYENVAAGWLHTIRDGRLALEASGLSHLTLRYEDLVTKPDVTIRRLEEELNLDLSRATDFHKESFIEAHTQRFKHHDNLKNPINANSVGKWRKQMTPAESEVFLKVAGPEMERWGYE